MHKEGVCANKWTRIGPNEGGKAMFFVLTLPITQPLPRK